MLQATLSAVGHSIEIRVGKICHDFSLKLGGYFTFFIVYTKQKHVHKKEYVDPADACFKNT